MGEFVAVVARKWQGHYIDKDCGWVAFGSPIRSSIRKPVCATEARIGRVEERTVRVQRDAAVCRQGSKCRSSDPSFDTSIVCEDSRRRHVKRLIRQCAPMIDHGARNSVHRDLGSVDVKLSLCFVRVICSAVRVIRPAYMKIPLGILCPAFVVRDPEVLTTIEGVERQYFVFPVRWCCTTVPFLIDSQFILGVCCNESRVLLAFRIGNHDT